MIATIEREIDQLFGNHLQYQCRIAQVKGGFGQHRFTGEKWLRHLLSHTKRPPVMHVLASGESYQEAGIGNPGHFLENPLRVETSRGPPRTTPASRMNFFPRRSTALASSKCERMNCPWETPSCPAACSIHPASFFVGRKVIV